MLFKKYHIIIMKDRESGVQNIRFRGWIGIFFILLLLALGAANIYLWEFYTKTTALEHQLEDSQRVTLEQNSQILGLASQIDDLASNLDRVERLDARLRVLMNIDKEQGQVMHREEESAQLHEQTRLSGNPQVLILHRELFNKQAFSLVSELSSRVYLEELGQQEILQYMQENKDAMLAMPSIWPAHGRLSSGFGYRRSPFGALTKLHKGLDIANKTGTPVMATAKGVVIFAGWDNAYGNSIRIDHGNNIVTRYAHLSAISVSVGQVVQRRTVIGAVGTTGRSTGPHLHYEVLESGTAVNPMRYILD